MGKNKLNVPKKQQHKNEHDNLSLEAKALAEQDPTLSEDSDNNGGANAFLWLFAFSVLMFTFPFITFYGVRSWLQESFDFDTFQTNCFSVLASVLVVNFILCLYVFKAFSEKTGPISSSSTSTSAASVDNKKSN